MQEDNNKKTKKRIIAIISAIIVILSILLMKSCGIIELINRSEADQFHEIDLSKYQEKIDDICNIELKEENIELIKLRIRMVDELLLELTDEQIDQLDLSKY